MITDIQYLAPTSLNKAINTYATANSTARILANNTDLLVQMHAGMITPKLIINIKNITKTITIEETTNKNFIISTAISNATLATHPRFAKAWPSMLEKLNLINSTQIQDHTSLGKNLCNNSPTTNSIPALIATKTTLTVQNPKNHRNITIEKIPTNPNKTSLTPSKITISFNFAPRPKNANNAYLQMIPHTKINITVINYEINLTLKNNIYTTTQIALGTITPTILLIKNTAKTLIENKLNANALATTTTACSATYNPINNKHSTITYRTRVAKVLLKHMTSIAAEHASKA